MVIKHGAQCTIEVDSVGEKLWRLVLTDFYRQCGWHALLIPLVVDLSFVNIKQYPQTGPVMVDIPLDH